MTSLSQPSAVAVNEKATEYQPILNSMFSFSISLLLFLSFLHYTIYYLNYMIDEELHIDEQIMIWRWRWWRIQSILIETQNEDEF